MKKTKVLFVDKQPAECNILMSYLPDSEFSTNAEASGEDALNFIRHDVPDVIILDITLPGISGYDVCKWLRSGQRTKKVPIILITDPNATDEKLRGQQVGADDFIDRPIDKQELIARVRSLARIRHYVQLLEGDNSDINVQIALGDQLNKLVTKFIRTPLISSYGALQLGLMKTRSLLDDKHRKHFEKAFFSLYDVVNTITNLFDENRINDNTYPFKNKSLDLQMITASKIQVLQYQIDQAEIEIEANYDEDIKSIEGDDYLIGRVVENLLSNAIRSAITQKERTVTVDLYNSCPEGEEETVILCFHSFGKTISTSQKSRIFQRFGLLDEVTVGRKYYGGTGLPFCKRIIEQYGGQIWFDSDSESGNSFYVSFVISQE